MGSPRSQNWDDLSITVTWSCIPTTTVNFHAMLLSDAPRFLQACGMFLYNPGCRSLPSMDYYYIACIIRLRGSFETNQITGYCLMLQLKLERIDHKNNCSSSRSGYK